MSLVSRSDDILSPVWSKLKKTNVRYGVTYCVFTSAAGPQKYFALTHCARHTAISIFD